MSESHLIDPIIKFAEKLASLTPAAIFAFMYLWQLFKEYKRDARESEIGEKSVEARLAISQALARIADMTAESADRIERIEVILDERLARRS